MSELLHNELLILFVVLAAGTWLGGLSLRGISLGTAGVFFVSMALGHFGFSVPKEIMDLGLLLFVFSVGLQAGPRFFRTFRRQGIQFVIVALAIVVTGAGLTVLAAHLLGLPDDLAAGLFAGSMTNTPALAGAIDSFARLGMGDSGAVSAGYGIAYPYSLVSIVLLMQFLPALLRRNVHAEEQDWQRSQQADIAPLLVRTFRVANPTCNGQAICQINPKRLAGANISRLRHGEQVSVVTPQTTLQAGDFVMAVGSDEELHKLSELIGEEAQVSMDVGDAIASVSLDVTEPALSGRSLAELRVWDRYSVVITRMRRQGVEIAPRGASTLQVGDSVHVVGEPAAVEQFGRLVAGDGRRQDETHMLPFLIGLVVGVAVGSINLRLPNGMSVRLGAAGGSFIVSLLLGHFGRIGPFRIYVPTAARNILRELGLMLFLAGAGANAGARLLAVLQAQGLSLFLAGAAITTLCALVGLFLLLKVFRMSLPCAMGALCAGMTNPPAFGTASAQAETDLPALGWASAYPVALISKVIVAQLLVELLVRI